MTASPNGVRPVGSGAEGPIHGARLAKADETLAEGDFRRAYSRYDTAYRAVAAGGADDDDGMRAGDFRSPLPAGVVRGFGEDPTRRRRAA